MSMSVQRMRCIVMFFVAWNVVLCVYVYVYTHVSVAPTPTHVPTPRKTSSAESPRTHVFVAPTPTRVPTPNKTSIAEPPPWDITEGECVERYTEVRCLDGNGGWRGSADVYGFTVINRTCLYRNLVWDGRAFVIYAKRRTRVPRVSLSSRPFDLPLRFSGRKIMRKVVGPTMDWAPDVILKPIPCTHRYHPTTLAYYSPNVAPWNFAHTLFNDLFALYWALHEHNLDSNDDVQVVANPAFYGDRFPLPNDNKAFRLFSKRRPKYDWALPLGVYANVVAGTGTKSWSFVTDRYSAPGTSSLWYSFRRHILRTTGVKERPMASKEKPVMTLCHKKDKRGVLNYDDALSFVRKSLPRMTTKVVDLAALSAEDQVRAMVGTDIYMCNEGTLATGFFMMPRGAVFISIPVVYHTPQLHQLQMPPAGDWWKLPDPIRTDPRKTTGGNIDWFPPAIDWIKTLWYGPVPMNETRIQLPLQNLRNYVPEYNVMLNHKTLLRVVSDAVKYVDKQRKVVDVPNYSINADICRQMMHRMPNLTEAFNSGRCYYGMSWLCEFFCNSEYKWRFLHEKWLVSRGFCGTRANSVPDGIPDPRDKWLLEDFTFFSAESAEKVHDNLDFPGIQLLLPGLRNKTS